MARPFLYFCPITGTNVQGLTSEDTTSEDGKSRVEMVRCLACGGYHYIDPSKGPLPPADEK